MEINDFFITNQGYRIHYRIRFTKNEAIFKTQNLPWRNKQNYLKKHTTDDIRARFLLAIDDTRLNGSQIGRRIRELGSQKIYNLKNGRNGVTLENLISFSKEFPQYNIKWIMYGEEEMLVKEKKEEPKGQFEKRVDVLENTIKGLSARIELLEINSKK